jgi:hypothetical protein
MRLRRVVPLALGLSSSDLSQLALTALPHRSLAMPKLDELLRENGRREPSRSLGPEGRPAKRQPSPEGLGING